MEWLGLNTLNEHRTNNLLIWLFSLYRVPYLDTTPHNIDDQHVYELLLIYLRLILLS